MKLLFDQNLSRHLVDHVRDAFPESAHVAPLGLSEATDEAVWDFAGANGYLVVSKDSDFRQLAFLHGPPPKVLWLRLGNVTTVDIATAILDDNEVIEQFASNEDEALLILPRDS